MLSEYGLIVISIVVDSCDLSNFGCESQSIHLFHTIQRVAREYSISRMTTTQKLVVGVGASRVVLRVVIVPRSQW